jgi:hypothetical protein
MATAECTALLSCVLLRGQFTELWSTQGAHDAVPESVTSIGTHNLSGWFAGDGRLRRSQRKFHPQPDKPEQRPVNGQRHQQNKSNTHTNSNSGSKRNSKSDSSTHGHSQSHGYTNPSANAWNNQFRR